MVNDPVRDVENPVHRIMRGSSIFTSRIDLQECGTGTRRVETTPHGRSTWYLGFRLSLTLPCNIGGSDLQ